MIQAKNNYSQNLQRINELGNIYDEIVRLAPTLSIQASQILRSQFVLIVSAFDTYIHDVVRIGILQEYQGIRPTTNGLNKLSIPYSDMLLMESQTPLMKPPTLDTIIRRIISKDTYQSSSNIEYALGLIGITGIWGKLSTCMSTPATDIKSKIDLIARRRNQIAHESDYNLTTGAQNPIDKALVQGTITFLDTCINSIQGIL